MKKRLSSFLLMLLIMLASMGVTLASAADPDPGSDPAPEDPPVVLPCFTASGSVLTLNANGHTVEGITYMYSDSEYEYTTWTKFVKEGKLNTALNTTNGYRSIKNHADGSSFEVAAIGWYNFVITYDGVETFCSVPVGTLSTKPSAVADGATVTFNAGDFTIRKVTWIYGGTTAYPCTSWSAMLNRGLADKAHNTSAGYRTITNVTTGTPYTFDETGYYTFLITYDLGEVICTVSLTNEKTLPTITSGTAELQLNFGDYTVTGCTYIWTSTLFSYTTWANFVSVGKQDTSANTRNGYRNFGTLADGATRAVSREGYYTAVITYDTDGLVGERIVSVHVETGALTPNATASGPDSIVTTNARGVSLNKIRYIYTGENEYTYTNLDAFIAKGKEFRGVNGSTGYRTVSGSLNDPQGVETQLYYAGWYTFLFSYEDGESSCNVRITESQARFEKPYAEIDGMDITIYSNDADLYEILYMYTFDPYAYTTWSDFCKKGKQNTYINSTTGYRTIDATGDTSFSCFELGYYNFILKYRGADGSNRERYVSVSPEDTRVNLSLQAMGGYVTSTDWQADEDNPSLFTRKAIGTIALPTPSVPKGSEIVQFAGWYTDLTYSQKVTTVNVTENTPDTTFYAKWIYSGTEFDSEYMHYGIGYATNYIASTRTQLWGITSAVSQVKMTCNHNGFFDYYSTNLPVITANSTDDLKGTAMPLPYTLGSSIFAQIIPNLYVAKVANTNGSYVEISFILYNSGSSAVTNFSIGCAADVNINGNGYAPIQANYDPEEGTYLLMEQSGYAFRIYMNEADYWIGRYQSKSPNRYFYNNVFNTSSDQANHWDKRFGSKDDSSLCFNWRNFDIPAGETVVKSIRIGVGSTASMGSTSTAIIQVDANGGAFADTTKAKTITATTAKIEVGTIEVPTREGYEFVGWNTSNVGAGISYASDARASNVKLYALWEKISSAKTYKLYNRSVITAGENAKKLGSATAKIVLNYSGGLIQQGTSLLNAVSSENDFVASIIITDGYYLPNNITVKVGSKWLTEGTDFIYSPNDTMTGGTLLIYRDRLIGTTSVYITGTDSPVTPPMISVSDATTFVKQSTSLHVTVDELEGYTYTYKWYKTDLLGTTRKALSSASAKTADLAFGGTAYGEYYYICKVTATRTLDGQSAETVSNVATVHVIKQELETGVLVDADGNVSLSFNPENKKAIFTFYTDAECTLKTGFESGAPDLGEKPIKPAEDGGSYYVQATIPEGKEYLACITEPVIYDQLPDLPFITTEGYTATINDNGTGVTAVKYMYSEDAFSYTKWSKYTKQGKLNKTANSSLGYRNISQKKDENGEPISMDGTQVQMDRVGYYTYLLSFGGDKEVAYTIFCSEADLAYHKPDVYQPSTNGRLVLIDDNDSHLIGVKYMYSADAFTYTKWAAYEKEGKKNTVVNTKQGFRYIKGTVTDDVSSLDGYAITLSNEGYYTFVMTYDDGAREKAETVYVSGDHSNNDNLGLLLVDNGTITASTANGDRIEYIKFTGDADYKTGNVLKVNTTGTYNIAAIDSNGYTYYMVAYIDHINNDDAPTVDKSALETKCTSATALENQYPDITEVTAQTAPGKYVLSDDKAALVAVSTEAERILADDAATQAEVNAACTALDSAMNAYKAAVFTVDPDLVSVDGTTINVDTTVEGYTLKLVRYNANEVWSITPSVWDNWTGFNSMRNRTITIFTEGGTHYSFYEVGRGIYTLIVQQNENGHVSEYYEYAIVTNEGETAADVLISYLEEKNASAAEVLENNLKESDADVDQSCISDSKWNGLASKKSAAEALIDQLNEDPSEYDVEKQGIPFLIEYNRSINQARSDLHVKTTPTTYDPLDVSINADNEVTFTHGNLSYVYVSYGHYSKWAKLKSAGYKKVMAAEAENDMYAAVYDQAKYNGEYTALVHYKDGSEEYKYFTLTGILYPFTVTENEGTVTVTIDPGTTATSVGLAYGADKKNLSDEAYVTRTSITNNEVTIPTMGNGMHTVNVQTEDASYFVNIEITSQTKPNVVIKDTGIAGVFTNGISDVNSVGMKTGSTQTRTGLTYPVTNEWLTFTPGSTYTFYYNIGNNEYYDVITF